MLLRLKMEAHDLLFLADRRPFGCCYGVCRGSDESSEIVQHTQPKGMELIFEIKHVTWNQIDLVNLCRTRMRNPICLSVSDVYSDENNKRQYVRQNQKADRDGNLQCPYGTVQGGSTCPCRWLPAYCS